GEEPADVEVGEVEIGQLVAEVDGVGQVAGFGAALGELEEQLLAGLVLGGGDGLQGILKVTASQTPVVAALEAVAQVELATPVQARVRAVRRQLLHCL